MEEIKAVTHEILQRLRGYESIEKSKNNLVLMYLIGYCDVTENSEVNFERILNNLSRKEAIKKNLNIIRQEVRGLDKPISYLGNINLQDDIISKILVILKSTFSTMEQYKRAFEYMLEVVVEQEGKQVGEFSTPYAINKLQVQMIEPSKELYDGTIGFGGGAIEAHKFAQKNGEEINIYGQELNQETYAISCIRMFMNGIDITNIKLGNTLANPEFKESKFDSIIMNPPLGVSWKNIEQEVKEDRYSKFIYGTPSISNADWLYISSALRSLNESGKMAITTTLGALFRSGGEEKLRGKIIGFDYIETVIELTGGLFNNTSIPCAIIICNMNKSEEMKNKIKFINASEIYESVRRGKKILNDENIEQILSLYRSNDEKTEVSKIVNINEIENANLLPSRYVVKTEFLSSNYGKVKINLDKLNSNKTLGEIGDFYRGINVTSKNIQDPNGNYKIINFADIKEGEVDINNLPSYSIENNARVETYKVNAGDIIISNKGATKICVIPEHDGDILISQNFIGIKVKSDYNPYYIKEFLESPVGEYLIESKKTGTAVAMINTKDLKDIPLVNMEIELQEKIMNDYNEEEQALKRKIQELQEKIDNKKMDLYDKMHIKNVFEIIKNEI